MNATAPRPTPLRVGIIGAGRFGTALARALTSAGCDVLLATSDRTRTVEAARGADVCFITVPDDAVAGVAAQLAEELATRDLPRLACIASGSVAIAALSPLVARGVGAARIHPLQMFTSDSGADEFRGVTAAIGASDEPSRAMAWELALELGLHPVALDEANRALWHAGATIAANYTVTLLAAARDLARAAGIEEREALEAFGALARVGIDRAVALGPEHALTGPVSRGDVGTIAAHLDALHDAAPELLETYHVLGERTASLARDAGRLDDATCAAVDEALSGGAHVGDGGAR